MAKNYLLDKDDVKALKDAVNAGGKVWGNDILKPFKRKFKDYYRNNVANRCCYCMKNFVGEHNMVIDIEHILPQFKFPKYTFTPRNLSIACKRCNLQMKGDDLSFIKDPVFAERVPFYKNNFRLIHPNLDKYEDHLDYESNTKNGKTMVKFTIIKNSEKGKFTYEYFELKKLEINSADNMQGIQLTKPLSSVLPLSIIKEIQQLFP